MKTPHPLVSRPFISVQRSPCSPFVDFLPPCPLCPLWRNLFVLILAIHIEYPYCLYKSACTNILILFCISYLTIKIRSRILSLLCSPRCNTISSPIRPTRKSRSAACCRQVDTSPPAASRNLPRDTNAGRCSGYPASDGADQRKSLGNSAFNLKSDFRPFCGTVLSFVLIGQQARTPGSHGEDGGIGSLRRQARAPEGELRRLAPMDPPTDRIPS